MAMRRPPRTIAIDGPAASGKSSVGRALAARLGYRFLDTGLMYRAFTLAALRAAIPPAAEATCTRLAEGLDLAVAVEAGTATRVAITGEDVTELLTSPPVEAAVSAYSAIAGVRAAMVRRQRAIARSGRVILAGRDIGTVVLPAAPLKLYLDASDGARTARRRHQAEEAGAPAEEAAIAVAARDAADASRETSPLRAAHDAIVIDTTGMTIEQVIAMALEKAGCAAS